MEITIFGQKMNIFTIILCIFLGYIVIPIFLGCSTYYGDIEGFSPLVGAPTGYKMGTGVPNSWETSDSKPYSYADWFSSLEGNTQAYPLPLADNQLAIFGANKFDPNCCPSTYSSSMGCVCETPEQAKYLNERGGNRTFNTIF